jgi:hypothetical protein
MKKTNKQKNTRNTAETQQTVGQPRLWLHRIDGASNQTGWRDDEQSQVLETEHTASS